MNRLKTPGPLVLAALFCTAVNIGCSDAATHGDDNADNSPPSYCALVEVFSIAPRVRRERYVVKMSGADLASGPVKRTPEIKLAGDEVRTIEISWVPVFGSQDSKYLPTNTIFQYGLVKVGNRQGSYQLTKGGIPIREFNSATIEQATTDAISWLEAHDIGGILREYMAGARRLDAAAHENGTNAGKESGSK